MQRSLRTDVRLFGDTLGQVVRAHGGDALFDAVESMRLSAKEAREAEALEACQAARERLAGIAEKLDPATARDVVKAFTHYFQLVNIAEDLERARAVRDRERAGEPFPESLAATVTELCERGATREEVLATLGELDVSYVFTAHPTEARRRTTERLLASARESLRRLDRRLLTPEEDAETHRALRAAVEALWEHREMRGRRPEVLEEVKAGLWYLRNVLLDQVPRMQRRLHAALTRAHGDLDADVLPLPVRFGSWMGGDRDGNPFVTDAITERTLELHRRIVLDRYLADLDGLADALAVHRDRLPGLPELDHAVSRAEAAVPEIVPEADRRSPDEPLRRFLTLMRARVEGAREWKPGGYPDAQTFLDDLRVVRRALQATHAFALADDALLDLIVRVRCFGFHLAALDVREDSRVHRRVVAELLGEPDYPQWDDDRRREALARLELPPRGAELSDETRRLLDLFESLGRLHMRFGPEALGAYVVTMTFSPVDVLEIYRLCRLHRIELDVVPLLETADALSSAETLLRELLADPSYRDHLRRQGELQEVLVGYSDSMKEEGLLASRASILEAQLGAAAACRDAGVRLRVFHGRGGSVSRGGGPTHRAIRALPPEAFAGGIRITEQGETRAFHFADPDLAERYMERTVGAALVLRWRGRRGEAGRPEGERALLDRLIAESRAAYRGLVETDGFLDYFRQATPLDQISTLNIASRPSKRGQVTGLADLRAIPWVFAWAQSRHLVTGWYGVGSALDAVVRQEGGLDGLREMYRRDPFLADLLDNVQMSLSKADLPIAERYAELAEPSVRERIFERVKAEYVLTRRRVLEVMGQDALLASDPVLQRSIRLRNPYVDPLSYVQIEALRRVRGGDEAWDRVAKGAVQGIAAGLRNTG